jgi:hypothetical protein
LAYSRVLRRLGFFILTDKKGFFDAVIDKIPGQQFTQSPFSVNIKIRIPGKAPKGRPIEGSL